MPECWFEQGLRFTCTQCGNCCTGAPGYVWVDDSEIEDLARRLGMPVETFVDRFVRNVGRRRSLRELPNGDCVFYDRRVGCTVYEQRPKQCQTWPFWESNLDSERSWRRMQTGCPGAGTGRLFTVAEILEQSQRIRI